MVSWLVCGVGLYAVWFAATDHIKRSPTPDALPAFPVRVAYWVISRCLWLVGVQQKAEFQAKLSPKGRYLIACMPHGAYAFSGALFIGPQWRIRDRREYATIPLLFCVASVLFYIPLVREFMLFIGARDATRSNVKDMLHHKCRPSITVIPGGIWEQVNTRHDEERCYVQRKLGFIRLAIEEGLAIVPMYGFGENQLFTIHTYWNSLRLWIADKFHVGLPLISGRWGITLIPHRTSITHVYGSPIQTTQQKNPSPEEIERVFVQFRESVERLFRENAGKYLPPEVAKRPLKIMRIGVDEDDRAAD